MIEIKLEIYDFSDSKQIEAEDRNSFKLFIDGVEQKNVKEVTICAKNLLHPAMHSHGLNEAYDTVTYNIEHFVPLFQPPR